MPRATWTAAAMLVGLLVLAGCADNPMVNRKLADYQHQQTDMQNQISQYQKRINDLDRDNQRNQALLAQSQQQSKLLGRPRSRP